MSRDQKERNRVFSFPVGQDPHHPRSREPQARDGFLVDWFEVCGGRCPMAPARRSASACPAGGHGRTGTALACLAILGGVPSTEAVAFVRQHYDPHAVETPGQHRYVARWPGNR